MLQSTLPDFLVGTLDSKLNNQCSVLILLFILSSGSVIHQGPLEKVDDGLGQYSHTYGFLDHINI